MLHDEPEESLSGLLNGNSSVSHVYLTSVIADPKNWGRKAFSLDMIKRYESVYRKSETQMPLIKLAKCGEGLFLFDGFHRFEAMKKAGVSSIDAEVYSDIEYRSLCFLSAKCNFENGIPLSLKEIRSRAFGGYIRAGMNRIGATSRLKSYQQITDDLGNVVNLSTIYRWMEKDFPATFEQMSFDGKRPNPFTEEFRIDKEQETLKTALDHIHQAQACSFALTTVEARADLKGALEETLQSLSKIPKARLEKALADEETDF